MNRRMAIQRLAVAGTAALEFVSAAVPVQSPVNVTRDPNGRDIEYSLTEGTCHIRWKVVPSLASSQPVILNYSRCRLPLTEQMPFLTRVLAEVQKTCTPGSFSWGRLTPDEPCDDLAMAVRVAVAAHRSPGWDVLRGRPRTGDVNAFALRLANEAAIYAELKSLFATFGLDLKLASVEKVLVLRASDLQFFDRLKAAGVRGAEKLPFDFQVFFGITAR